MRRGWDRGGRGSIKVVAGVTLGWCDELMKPGKKSRRDRSFIHTDPAPPSLLSLAELNRCGTRMVSSGEFRMGRNLVEVRIRFAC